MSPQVTPTDQANEGNEGEGLIGGQSERNERETHGGTGWKGATIWVDREGRRRQPDEREQLVWRMREGVINDGEKTGHTVGSHKGAVR